MKFDNAIYTDGELRIKTADPSARRFVYNFAPGEYEINKAAKKRSNDANAYCWELCTKISAAVGATKEDVYRRAIAAGNQYAALTIRPDALGAFDRIWRSGRIGWVTQVIDDTPDGNLVFAYYGSSAYDTKQMAELLDRIIEDCRALGIETRPEEEVESLLEAWSGR